MSEKMVQVGVKLPTRHVCISFSFVTKSEPGPSIIQPCLNSGALPSDASFSQLLPNSVGWVLSVSVNYALVQYRECKIQLSCTKDCNISLKSGVSKRSIPQSCYILFGKFPEGSEANQQGTLSGAASRNYTCFGLDLVWPCSCGTCIAVNMS